MTGSTRRITGVAVVFGTLLAGLGLTAAASIPAAGASAATPAATMASTSARPPAPAPYVDHNRIVDATTGTTFVPHGVNWPSFEYACSAKDGPGWGYSQGTDTQAAADAMAAWHINTVRLPLNQDCWLGLNPTHNYGTAAGYRAALKSWVDILNGDGIVVILDLHWNAPAGKLAEDQFPMADAQSIDFWKGVAGAYKSDPSVIFDLFNEPYSRWDGNTKTFNLTWDCWEDGGCNAPDVNQGTALDGGTYPVVGMSQLVDAVRSTGATQPLMLGGTDYANDLTGWLAHEPNDSVPAHTVAGTSVPAGSQLIASWHNYPEQDCHTVSCWNSEIAPVAAVVPVVAGEFGETDGTADFMKGFMSWADTAGIGYLPWAWWDVKKSEDPDNSLYALETGPNFTPKAPDGTAFHDHLAALGRTTSPVAIANPGFEGSIAGWKRHTTGVTITLGTLAGRAHAGTGFLAARASHSGRGIQQTVTLPGSANPALTVTKGDSYTESIWLRTSTTHSERVRLTLVADGGTAEHAKSTVTLTRSWRRFTVTLSVHRSGHRDVRLSVYLESAGRAIDLDDVALTVTR